MTATDTSPTALTTSVWLERKRAHEERVRPWIEPRLERQSRGEKHPVYDFLFDYYSFRPSLLRRWHPGIGVTLMGEAAREFLRWPEYRQTNDEISVQTEALPPHRRESVRWIANLLELTRDRPAHFGCFGLHEWAMVYRQTAEEIRHNTWPLRFSAEETARIVESQQVRCTHFDAFRFFTPPARPLNRVQPERPIIRDLEQRGCLHANMDLYKWTFKLAPFAPGELMADCFALAGDIREIDMRASPYDFSSLGFSAIKIETAEGRAEYEQHQRRFAERAQPLREQLIEICQRIIANFAPNLAQANGGNEGAIACET